MKDYLERVGSRRMVLMVLGNIFLGMGVGIFKFSGLGNDPFSGMVMALADCVGMAYANFLVLLNIVLFAVQFMAGRKLIGAGTFFNAILQGYIATFFYHICINVMGAPQQFWQRVIIVVIGVIVCSFGLSMYQTSDAGVAPYDSLSLITKRKLPQIPYFWHRMFTDALCALICFLAGGIVGLGTLVCAFGMGPIIHFFDVNFTEKYIPNSV